jgi:hypothetical protein
MSLQDQPASNKFAQINELYDEPHVDLMKHNKSIRYHGMVSYLQQTQQNHNELWQHKHIMMRCNNTTKS